jgi:hypothetical protein
MPADAVAGLFEVVAALLQAIVEALILMIELAVELGLLLVELVLYLIGKSRRMARPSWVVRRRESAAGRIKSLVIAVLFLSAIGYGSFQCFGYTHLSFSHNAFIRPDRVEVMLIRGESIRSAMIEDGILKVRRGRWDRLVVHDPRYHPSDFAITGRRMDLHLEKIQTTREAATEAVIDKAAELLRKKFDRGEEANEKE